MLEVAICPKCGEVNYPALESYKKCYCCWVGFLKRPRKLLFEVTKQLQREHFERDVLGSKEAEYLFWYEKFLKDCPEYDNSLYEEHLNNNRRWDLVTKQRLNELSSKPTVKCPYCGSLRTTKISTSSRVASSLTLGLASNKIGKNYQCNDCKATF